ncbi:hypothetical protein GCM10010428_07330 [Actinosynnema pretiosum subsp. pretiosum]
MGARRDADYPKVEPLTSGNVGVARKNDRGRSGNPQWSFGQGGGGAAGAGRVGGRRAGGGGNGAGQVGCGRAGWLVGVCGLGGCGLGGWWRREPDVRREPRGGVGRGAAGARGWLGRPNGWRKDEGSPAGVATRTEWAVSLSGGSNRPGRRRERRPGHRSASDGLDRIGV